MRTKAYKQTTPTKRYNTDALNNQTIASKYAVEVHNRYALLQNLDPGDQNIDDAFETFKCAVHESASNILGKPNVPRKKTSISESTLNIIEDQRAIRLRGDKPEVKVLTRERNHALGLDQGRYWDAKAAAIESAVARQDQHTVFRELRICKLGLNNQQTTVQAEDSTRLTNTKDCLCRWKYHFNDLLNKPCGAKDAELQRDADQATPDADLHTDPVTSREVELCLKRLENRRAPGICSINVELLKKGGDSMIKWLAYIINIVWIKKTIPDD